MRRRAERASLLAEGRFRLDGADPERTYRVFFLEAKRRLGAVADLKYDPKGPAVVPLQPTATAKGIWSIRRAGRSRGPRFSPGWS